MSPSHPSPVERLRVLSVTSDPQVAELIRKIFTELGDEVDALTDLAAAVLRAQEMPPDVAFVDVGVGQGAALALVHHVKAVSEDADVYALANTGALEAASQAISLGAIGLIISPPSGDELIGAANAVRTRRAVARQKIALKREAEMARRCLGYVGRLASLADRQSREEVAETIAEVFREAAGAAVAAIYLPAAEGSTELRRVTVLGDLDPITYTDEMGLMSYAHAQGLEVVPLLAGKLAAGHILLGMGSWREEPALRMAAHALAAQATTTLALVTERERSSRGTIKDFETSAYAFAYFVDIAGREIDKANRHGRKFALATIGVGEPSPDGKASTSPVDVAETVLGAVRDSDVLARVDDREFYLLLPETAGLGAHSCRRRVLALTGITDQRVTQPRLAGVTMGVATYPHDGGDLLKLLRMAKRRADASRTSIVHKLKLGRMPLSEMVDALSWDNEIASGKGEKGPETARAIELPMNEVLALLNASLSQAMRGGAISVVVSSRESIGLAASVRGNSMIPKDSVQAFDIRHRDGCEDIEALSLVAEHGAYSLLGRVEGGMFRGVHAADPLLADLVAQRLGDLAGLRAMD